MECSVAIATPYERFVAVLLSVGTASSDGIAIDTARHGRFVPACDVTVRHARAVPPPERSCPHWDDAPLCDAKCLLSSDRGTRKLGATGAVL